MYCRRGKKDDHIIPAEKAYRRRPLVIPRRREDDVAWILSK
jgi:hypothetical protein